MKLEILTPEELKKAYETDLSEAFPPSELKPLSAMERLREQIGRASCRERVSA